MNNGEATRCPICPHACVIPEGGTGYCGVRVNKNGCIQSDTYGVVSGIALDPIEKKPLRRFCEGSMILSIGGYGCNLRCPFCQNSHIAAITGADCPVQSAPRDTHASLAYTPTSSAYTHTSSAHSHASSAHSHASIADREATHDLPLILPAHLAAMAQKYVPKGNIGVAYTYNEPLINYEYLLDCAKAVREAGLKNVLVTNGLINPKPLEALLPFIDAMNIDLKGFTEDFYAGLAGYPVNKKSPGGVTPEGVILEGLTPGGLIPKGEASLSFLDTVKNTIVHAQKNCHIEVTTLIIPNENETHAEPIARWLAEISPEIPYHISRFFPRHNYADKQSTPPQTLRDLAQTARKYLKYVYTGNL